LLERRAFLSSNFAEARGALCLTFWEGKPSPIRKRGGATHFLPKGELFNFGFKEKKKNNFQEERAITVSLFESFGRSTENPLDRALLDRIESIPINKRVA
jgi:hypothetical protein